MSLATLLTVVFVVLKLTDVIDWGWFYVLLPSIIGIGLGFILALVYGLVAANTQAAIRKKYPFIR